MSFIYKEREIITTINRSNLSNFKSVMQTGTGTKSYVNEWQARVGSLYYPQASIRTTPDIGARLAVLGEERERLLGRLWAPWRL